MLKVIYTKEDMLNFINQLKKIMDSETPFNPDHTKTHAEKVKNASLYQKELKHIVTFWPDGFSVYRVNKRQLKKFLAQGQYSLQDEDSHFSLYMKESPRHYLLYLHPISKLKEEDFWDI